MIILKLMLFNILNINRLQVKVIVSINKYVYIKLEQITFLVSKVN